MRRADPQFCETLAYALWRSAWRHHLTDLDACRMAARDLAGHLERAGYQVQPPDPLVSHGGSARAKPRLD